MYLYSLVGYEENEVVQHEKRFTEEEFNKMCNETPNRKLHDSYAVEQYLIENYGFKSVEYSASFDISK